MGTSHRKIKSVAKLSVPKNDLLKKKILDTMKQISDIVGATLGPGGCPVLIERQEFGVPNLITKDGVTVFRSLGFNDPIAHAIMETARDAAIRTAVEAGDGTTTASVLAEAIVRYTHEFCEEHPKVSSQRVVRILEKLFTNLLEPKLKSLAIQPDRDLLHAVAKCSANGDQELADAVQHCFDLTGDDGNVTIYEANGPSAYKVEPLKGYPVGSGYEDSCGRFYPMFVNDQANARCFIEKPIVVLNFGTITEITQLAPLMTSLTEAVQDWYKLNDQLKGTSETPPPRPPTNVLVVSTGFSESVLANLGTNFKTEDTINIVPLLIPRNAIQSGQLHLLQDLQAVTGSTIFDPISRPLMMGSRADLGHQLDSFEMYRYRSNIIGVGDEEYLRARADELKAQVENNAVESDLEMSILKERLGKLIGGIAKLTVVGSSSGEIREKKDRAEDAVCAIRGAIKFGCLPGGCWGLLSLVQHLLNSVEDDTEDLVIRVMMEVLGPALEEPFQKMLRNCGFNDDEIKTTLHALHDKIEVGGDPEIFDALEQGFVPAKGSGIMDSVPAVLEAIRNSISIASLLGTLGGCVVFPRDNELERSEAVDAMNYMSDD